MTKEEALEEIRRRWGSNAMAWTTLSGCSIGLDTGRHGEERAFGKTWGAALAKAHQEASQGYAPYRWGWWDDDEAGLFLGLHCERCVQTLIKRVHRRWNVHPRPALSELDRRAGRAETQFLKLAGCPHCAGHGALRSDGAGLLGDPLARSESRMRAGRGGRNALGCQFALEAFQSAF